MKFKQTVCNKFSVVLAALYCMALPVLAAAQEKIVFYSARDGAGQIWAMNPDGSNPTNLSNNGFFDYIPDASATGNKIAFVSTRDGGDEEIYVMNGDGTNQTRLTFNPGWDFQPTISGDGSKIAFVSERDGNWEIYVVNSDGTNLTRLTNNTVFDSSPSFSEDGTKILFTSGRDNDAEIYVMNADGSNPTRLTYTPGLEDFAEFNAAGNKIVFQAFYGFSNEIYVMDADGSNQVNMTNSFDNELYPSFSPDGSKIAFSTERDGDWEVYMINADGTNPVNVTNFPAGTDLFPSWSSLGGPIGPPTDKNQCKNGGWKIFNFPRTFDNQGDCIDFVNNNGITAFQPTNEATSGSRHSGGVNVVFGDGSVRFISNSATGGVNVAVGDVNGDGQVQRVEASKIYLPNSPLEFDFVDARDPNAESKARALFDAAYRLRSGIVVTISQGTLETGKVPVVNFLVNDGGDTKVLKIELEPVLISSYQVGGSDGSVPTTTFTLNFGKIEYK